MSKRVNAQCANFFALGFYLGVLLMLLVVGQGAFNAAVPNPWRLLLCAPSVVALCFSWRAINE